MRTSPSASTASLTLVGTGIKFKAHLTTEAITYIKNSDVVAYLVNEPAIKEWIINNSRNALPLDALYGLHALRNDTYAAMTESVLSLLRTNQHVCFVLYGHPAVFAKPGIDAVNQARKEGYFAQILPGISAEDCLLADLLINPATTGCQSYEATDLLVYQRKIDPCCCIIVWQVGFIGALGYPANHDNKPGITLLTQFLRQYYDVKHSIILYEAAQYPHMQPTITHLTLEELPSANCTPLTTLCILPSKKAEANLAIMKSLKIVMNIHSQ